MSPDKLGRANALAAEIKHMEGFIKAIPVSEGANSLVAIKVLSEDYHDTAIDYLNSDLFDLLTKAKRLAERHLAELKDKFERL